jgi:hypothetical protein
LKNAKQVDDEKKKAESEVEKLIKGQEEQIEIHEEEQLPDQQ